MAKEFLHPAFSQCANSAGLRQAGEAAAQPASRRAAARLLRCRPHQLHCGSRFRWGRPCWSCETAAARPRPHPAAGSSPPHPRVQPSSLQPQCRRQKSIRRSSASQTCTAASLTAHSRTTRRLKQAVHVYDMTSCSPEFVLAGKMPVTRTLPFSSCSTRTVLKARRKEWHEL